MSAIKHYRQRSLNSCLFKIIGIVGLLVIVNIPCQAMQLKVQNKEAMIQKIKAGKCFDLKLKLEMDFNESIFEDIAIYPVQSHEDSIISTGGKFDPAYKIYSNTQSPLTFHCEGKTCDLQRLQICFKNSRTIDNLTDELTKHEHHLKHKLSSNIDVIPDHDTFFYAPDFRIKPKQAALYSSFSFEMKDKVKENLAQRGIKPLDELINYVMVLIK